METTTEVDDFTLEEVYVRTHWLVIAQLDRIIADAEIKYAKNMSSAFLQVIRLMEEQRHRYMYEHKRVMQTHSYTTMRRAITHMKTKEAIATENNREFDYLRAYQLPSE